MHTSIDGATTISDHIILSNIVCYDSTLMDFLITEKGTIYICDKGYVEYKKLDRYIKEGIYFVSRLKDNAKFEEVESLPITKCTDTEPLLFNSITILFDKKVRLEIFIKILLKVPIGLLVFLMIQVKS